VKSKSYEGQKYDDITYLSVFKKRDSIISQWYGQRKLDSIASVRIPLDTERSTYYSRERYIVQIVNDTITFNETVANTKWIYSESIKYEWKLGGKSKVINGYECKNAFTTYGGRNWEAWYSKDVPLDVGLYKFKGLPGMIISINDKEHLFTFELYDMGKRNNLKFTVYEPTYKEYDIKQTTRKEFNEFKRSYNSLSLNEQLNYLNKDKPGRVSFKMTSSDESIGRGFNAASKTNTVNYIEIDGN